VHTHVLRDRSSSSAIDADVWKYLTLTVSNHTLLQAVW
jgi:hypothetical protein